MKKFIRLFFRIAIILLLIVALYLGSIIGLGTVTDYRPHEISELEINGARNTTKVEDSVFTFLSWNIGFAGLGAEMDFFYDGGKSVHPSTENIEKYTLGILNFLKNNDTIDFILLQEVDKNSARTNNQNEIEQIQNTLISYTFSFGLNYKVFFVPLPLTNPLGKVEMGQLNLSRYQPSKAYRYAYFSEYAWPKKLFMLDRCFVVSKFQLNNGKELVVLNTHNSAYDAGGKLREQEMPVIRDFMLNEFKKGNYVIAGGDWNQNPPLYKKSELQSDFIASDTERLNFSTFPEKWQVVYDVVQPTNRSISFPLKKGKTKVTIIDYYIVSPNISVEKINVLPQGFEFSDHEAVYIKIKLKKTN